MTTEKTSLLKFPVITAIIFNDSESMQPVPATSSVSDFTAEEIVKPSGADAQKAIEVIRYWQAAEDAIAKDNNHMPPLSTVLHNSLVGTKGYESSIVQITSQLPSYPNGHLETKVTADYVVVTSLISEADQHRLWAEGPELRSLAAPKSETTSTALVAVSGGELVQSAGGPVKLWAEPKQAVHTLGFAMPKPNLLEEDHTPKGLSNEWFDQQLKIAA